MCWSTVLHSFYVTPTTYECEKDPLQNRCGPDMHINNSSTVGVYLTVTFFFFFCKAVSTVDVAVVYQ